MAAAPLPSLAGVWGGDRANLQIAETGGRLTLDCASGSLPGELSPDAAGHFAVDGSWEAYKPGPQPGDALPATVPARFEGQLKGDTLHLVVKAGGEERRLTLVRGRQVKLVRCL